MPKYQLSKGNLANKRQQEVKGDKNDVIFVYQNTRNYWFFGGSIFRNNFKNLF